MIPDEDKEKRIEEQHQQRQEDQQGYETTQKQQDSSTDKARIWITLLLINMIMHFEYKLLILQYKNSLTLLIARYAIPPITLSVR